MNVRVDGQRALVTGASSGIGRAVALALAESGAKVAVNYRTSADAAEEVVAQIRGSRGEAFAVRGDVADRAAVPALFAALDRQWGGIDILVNNAGIDGPSALSWEADPAAWDKVIAVNLGGAFACAREALQRMVPREKGVIVNITSVHESIAWSGYSAYTASKAAVSMLTKTLAQEAAPFGVRVVAVAPGAIKTQINRAAWDHPKGMSDLLDKIPLKRIGEPDDIASMVVMLASSASSYVTGCTVFVDGGMTDYPNFSHGG